MNRVTRCTGMKQQTFPYAPDTVVMALIMINQLRPGFIEDCKKPELWQGEVLAGHWVKDDGHVMCMLRSSASADAFKAEPLTWVLDALQACAEHDWLVADKIRA